MFLAVIISSSTSHTASTAMLISEVLYDPPGDEPDAEWIELYNYGSVVVELTGYKIGDAEASGDSEGMLRFPAGATIAPGEVIVIANKATTFYAMYGFQPDYEILSSDPAIPELDNYTAWAYGSVALHNDGDEVLILGPEDNIVDAVAWGNSSSFLNPPVNDVIESHSIERYPTDIDTDVAEDWRGQDTPNPGVAHLVAPRVHTAEDAGPGTLRQALLWSIPEAVITFNTAMFPPEIPTTIYPLSEFPPLNHTGMTLDASDSGVILDGSLISGTVTGLRVLANTCTIQGLTIQNFDGDGISIAVSISGTLIGGNRGNGVGPNGQGNLIVNNAANGIAIKGNNNRVVGNYIGIDGSGLWDWGNGANGVLIYAGASHNVVGSNNTNERNIISSNRENGVWIGDTGTTDNQVIGNYIGTNSNGMGPVSNHLSGIAIQNGASANVIGGTSTGTGNLISGNYDNGVYVSDPGTQYNQISGNIIGPDRTGNSVIGQGLNGIVITNTSYNLIGGTIGLARNLISGNSLDGICIKGNIAISNTVQGNIIGSNRSGSVALPNGLHGIELTDGTSDNLIGGDISTGESNLISGNSNHGLVITEGAHHNVVSGNLIGPDITGMYSLGQHPMGGIDITNGAHHNIIGGESKNKRNLISGNETDGIALFKSTGEGVTGTQIMGNWIGLAWDGSPLSNGGFGILNATGTVGTHIMSNTIAYNKSRGVLVASCDGNSIRQNSIYSNTLEGIAIEDSRCEQPPYITGVNISETVVITGTTVPNARIEIFSDDMFQGRTYEGYTQADGEGNFVFQKNVEELISPNITATATDIDGNTSEFSSPVHTLWTILLYLNGDNDLEAFMFDVLTNTASIGANPRANILALLDGYTTTVGTQGTVLYDLTYGQAIEVSDSIVLTGELNMGDGKTLVDFVKWGKEYYPARYTMLSILDHGGGWAPSNEILPIDSSTRARHRHWCAAGNSGMSWDFSSGYDYMDSIEIRSAIANFTEQGNVPLDVLFYDVCLMGMVEIAYDIKDYASFFVSAQNLGWAPSGPDNRYIKVVRNIAPEFEPEQMAEALVQAYATATPPKGHPFTISAVDLEALTPVAEATDSLALALMDVLATPYQAENLHQAYVLSQKIDYNSDFEINPYNEGFVDLYDFALNLSTQFTETTVLASAEAVMTALDNAVIAEEHRSGNPWPMPNHFWDLDNAHGLSIFLPLGEDLEFSIMLTETSPISASIIIRRNLRLRDLYTPEQLQFVADTSWDALINIYYDIFSASIPTHIRPTTQEPVGGLQVPDVTPPKTTMELTGPLTAGEVITINWTTVDTQTGVEEVRLWHRSSQTEWYEVGAVQTLELNQWRFVLQNSGENAFSVRSIDAAGNMEPLQNQSNIVVVMVASKPGDIFLPVILREINF